MSDYIFKSSLNPGKIFILQKKEVIKRLDPAFYYELLNNKFDFSHPTKTISRIVKCYSGGTPNKSVAEYWDGEICWASPKDMKDFYLTNTEDKITMEGVENSATYLAPVGSILIVFRSGILQHTLPVSVTKVETTINQDLKVLVPSDEILPEYLATFLKTFEKRILPRIVKHSTTVQSINQEEFNQLTIPIPPIGIQKKIIDINKNSLSQKQKNEAEAQKLLSSIDDYLLKELGIILPTPSENNLKSRIFKSSINKLTGNRYDPFYHQSYFVNIFNAINNSTYQVVPLKKAIFNFVKGVEVGSAEYLTEGISFVRVADITDFAVNVESADKKISKTLYAELEKNYKPKIGEILYSKDGTIGFCVIVEKEEDYILSSGILRINCNKGINNYFLKYILASKLYKQLADRVSIGTIIKHLTIEDWLNIPIPIPPPSKQKEIAEHITEIRQQAQQLKDKTKDLLKKASEEIEEILLN